MLRTIHFGHSYCIAINRSIERQLSNSGVMGCTCIGPSDWPGDLRPVQFEPEPEGSGLISVGVRTSFSRYIHLFNYDKKGINQLLQNDWDLAYLWQEPYCRVSPVLTQALKKRGIPYVFFTAQNISKNYPWPFSSWERQVVDNAVGWIACGKTVFETQVKRGYPEKTGIILPHAVDTRKFKPFSVEGKRTFNEKFGHIQGPVIGFAGRLTEQKGVRILLEAVEKLPNTMWGSLIFFGSGPLRDVVYTWAKIHGVSEKVRINLVAHEEMPSVMGGLDVLVAPSQSTPNWREQFGRMLIEAMAAGVPIITSDSGEIPYTVGDAGLLVGEKDVEGFSRCILNVLNNRSLRDDLIARGLRRSLDFSVANLAPKYGDFWLEKARRN